MSSEIPMPKSPEELAAAAIAENWPLVDSVIGSVADDDTFLTWANGHVEDEDSNVRDLAVSLYEASTRELSSQFGQKLFEIMEADENFFVQFRAACAIFKNSKRRDREILAKIRQGLDNEDTALVAQHYLELYREQQEPRPQ